MKKTQKVVALYLSATIWFEIVKYKNFNNTVKNNYFLMWKNTIKYI